MRVTKTTDEPTTGAARAPTCTRPSARSESDTLRVTRRALLVLLAASLALFSANMWRPSLISLDDATYARQGIEERRSGQFFNPTWNGQPDFHKPPLQFWLLGRSFALFGENDFAARLPSALMALGILAATYWIGALTVGSPAGATGVAFLLLSPYFTDHARRVMLDLPLAFWTTLVMLVFLEGVRRAWITTLVAIPLGAALLTKSALGLLPVLAILGSAAVVPALRPSLKRPWPWISIALGLGLAATWSVYQLAHFGTAAFREHYAVELGSRATPSAHPAAFVMRYPWILLDSYQPVIIPAVVGAVMLWRNRAALGPLALVPAVWAFLPILALNFMTGRSPRYLVPMFPPLALCAGFCIAHAMPSIARALWRWFAPALVTIAAIILWTSPGLLRPLHQSAQDPNRDIKRSKTLLQQIIPAGESVAFFGTRYWGRAAPLLYYAERSLDPSVATVREAIDKATSRPSRLLLTDLNRLGEIDQAAVPYRVAFTSQDWVLVEFRR